MATTGTTTRCRSIRRISSSTPGTTRTTSRRPSRTARSATRTGTRRSRGAVVVKGPLDKPGSKDGGYTVEMSIPWASFDKATNHPPKPFDTWRINLYAMKNNSGVAWSPIKGQGNFHKASRFGKVVWSVPGMTPPVASASAAAAAPEGRRPRAGYSGGRRRTAHVPAARNASRDVSEGPTARRAAALTA